MNEDAMAEKMAEEIFQALEPIRGWFDTLKDVLDEHTADTFDRAHEDCEILLMKLLDRYYGGGFKDGAAEERYAHEAAWEHSHEA